MRSIVAIWRDRRKMPSIAMHLAMRSAWPEVPAMRWSPLMMPAYLVPSRRVEHRGRERGRAREAGGGDGQASGEDGLGQPLGHLPGARVPAGQQQDGGQR